MALIGLETNRKNPPFEKEDFTFWMPQYKKFLNTKEGDKYFTKLYEKANKLVFKSVFGTDWDYAMSLVIAHYLTLISQQEQNPSGSSLSEIAGGGAIKGVISSASVGNFNKTYDLDKTMITGKDATFWNQTSYGAQFMALKATKSPIAMFVVTNGNIGER